MGKFYKFILLFFAFSLFFSNNSSAAIYKIDNVHSAIDFSVKHLGVASTKGGFSDFAGTIDFDPADILKTRIEIVIQASSIDTRNQARDEHLRNQDFFDTIKYPVIQFVSKKIKKNRSQYMIVGDLTMKGVTKEISFVAHIAGPIKSPMGAEVIGISAEGQINRQDFGITWSKSLDSGGYIVGNEVNAMVEIEAQKAE